MTRAKVAHACLAGALAILAAPGCGGATPPAEVPDEGAAVAAPPPSSPATPAVGPVGPASAPSGLEGAKRFGPLYHLWTVETGDWNGGLLVTDAGDVLSFSSRGVRVHAREDGRVLHQTASCAPVSEDAVAFVSAAEILVVCSDELRSLSWPKLGSRRVIAFPKRVDRAAIAGGVVAVAEDGFFAADKKGTVSVLDARDGRELETWAAPAEVETLALSPDGARLFVGTRDAASLVRDLRAKRSEPWPERRGGGGAAFSPDGRTVFGDFASFEASAVEVDSGRATKTWHVGSWLTASRWLDANTVAATGSDGLGVFTPTHGEPAHAPVDDLGEGIAISRDGSTLCAGGRGGRVACFGKARPAPSTYAAPKLSGDATGSSSGRGPDVAPTEVDATLARRTGNRLEVSVDPAVAIEVGATGNLMRPFQSHVGFVLSGWIVVAEVKVVAARSGKVTLELVAEKSAMTVNGRRVDHFSPGPARLQLTAPPGARP